MSSAKSWKKQIKKDLSKRIQPISNDFLIIAGDVSATNILMTVYHGNTDHYSDVFSHNYPGQEVTDFNKRVLEDLLSRAGCNRSQITRMVLAPAGKIMLDGTCEMTNAPFSLDAKTTGIETLLINDFAAKAYAVSRAMFFHDFDLRKKELNHVRLRHTDGSYGQENKQSRIVVHGPGTGHGTCTLVFDEKSGLYLPLDSEGGHKYAPVDVDDSLDIEIVRYIKNRYLGTKKPHLEALSCGKGIERIFEYLFFKAVQLSQLPSKDQIVAYNKSSDKAEYIAEQAKLYPDSIFNQSMSYLWKHTGMAVHDNIVQENSTSGVFLTGGVIRKNIMLASQVDPRVEYPIMSEVENGPTHQEWVNKVPVNVVLEKNDGLNGARAVAFNEKLYEKERAKFSY